MYKARSKVRVADLCTGCVVWLPARSEFNEGVQCSCPGHHGSENLGIGGYNHPVVVLRIRPSRLSGDFICDVACITTFSDTLLETYITERTWRHHLQSSIPIFQQYDSHVSTNLEQLCLQNGSMQKQSYARTNHMYAVEASRLRTYSLWMRSPKDLRLENQSCLILLREYGVEEVKLEATGTVPKASARRPRSRASMSPYDHLSPTIPTVELPVMQVPRVLQPPSYDYYSPNTRHSSNAWRNGVWENINPTAKNILYGSAVSCSRCLLLILSLLFSILIVVIINVLSPMIPTGGPVHAVFLGVSILIANFLYQTFGRYFIVFLTLTYFLKPS